MGAISRLCHFAQRCDSDGLPPLGCASGEDHGIGRTRTRVTHQEACDVLVIYLAPLPRGFLFGLGTLVRFRCHFGNLRFVHNDGVARQGSDTQQRLQKMLRVERDQMVKTFVPDGPDQALNISVLPRRAERGGPISDPHCSHAGFECAVKCSVIVANEIFRCAVPRKRFGDLAPLIPPELPRVCTGPIRL